MCVHHHFRDPVFNDPFFLSVFAFPRSDLVERNAMLRTKAMREKEEQRERRKYNYTLLRIRLPDGNLLQGKHRSLKIHSAQYTRVSNQTSQSFVQSPVRNGSEPEMCDSRDFLCMGPAVCAVWVCTGVLGGGLAAL